MTIDVSTLGGATHSCGHCLPYWARIRSGEVAVEAVEDRGHGCPACGRPLIVGLIAGTGMWRCVECGIADLATAGHVVEEWWAERPSAGALSTGWGGSDIWACSCGARDEDLPGDDQPREEEWAGLHAASTNGRVNLPPYFAAAK